jgi:hypothetical protein
LLVELEVHVFRQKAAAETAIDDGAVREADPLIMEKQATAPGTDRAHASPFGGVGGSFFLGGGTGRTVSTSANRSVFSAISYLSPAPDPAVSPVGGSSVKLAMPLARSRVPLLGRFAVIIPIVENSIPPQHHERPAFSLSVMAQERLTAAR